MQSAAINHIRTESGRLLNTDGGNKPADFSTGKCRTFRLLGAAFGVFLRGRCHETFVKLDTSGETLFLAALAGSTEAALVFHSHD